MWRAGVFGTPSTCLEGERLGDGATPVASTFAGDLRTPRSYEDGCGRGFAGPGASSPRIEFQGPPGQFWRAGLLRALPNDSTFRAYFRQMLVMACSRQEDILTQVIAEQLASY